MCDGFGNNIGQIFKKKKTPKFQKFSNSTTSLKKNTIEHLLFFNDHLALMDRRPPPNP